MRIVLDTNVLIAAFISHGTCNELLEHCALNHTVVLSPFIVNELKTKLTMKFGYSAREAAAVARLLRSRFTSITPESLARGICRDPDDDVIIATAITGRCDCIVTGDKDLLVLGDVQGVHIIAPSEFWGFEDH